MNYQRPQLVTPPPSRQEERPVHRDQQPPQLVLHPDSHSTSTVTPNEESWASPHVFQSPDSYTPWTMVPCNNSDLTESPPVAFERSPYAWIPLPDVGEGDFESLDEFSALPTPPPSPTIKAGSRTRSRRRRGASANVVGLTSWMLQDSSHHVQVANPSSTTMQQGLWIVHSVASAIAPESNGIARS